VSVDAKGKVERVEVVGTSGLSRPAVSCCMGVVYTSTFRPSREGAIRLLIPVVFGPKSHTAGSVKVPRAGG
jgi:hypothetical protein